MTEAKPKVVDPAIQAIKEALLEFMGSTYMTSSASCSLDGQGTSFSINAEDYSRNRWTYTEYTAGQRVQVAPSGAAVAAGGTQQFTATAINPDGSAVSGAQFAWSMVTGLGAIDANGLYTAPATIASATTDTIRCQLQGVSSWTTVTVTLTPVNGQKG